MSKSFKFKNENYLDSTGIVHNKQKLNEILYGFSKAYYGGKILNANDFTKSGIYTFDTNNTISNRPPKVINNLEILVVLETHNTSNTIQIWFNFTGAIYFRLKYWGTWSEWKKINIS